MSLEPKPTDPEADDIVRWERAERRSMRGLLVVGVLTFAAVVALYMAVTQDLIGTTACQWLGLAFLVAFLIAMWRFSARTVKAVPVFGDDEDFARRTVDLQQNRWHRTIRVLLINPVIMVVPLIAILARHRPGEAPFAAVFAAVFGFMVLTALLGTFCGPPGARHTVVDEVTKDNQIRAARLGFVLALSLLCALCVVGAWNAALLVYLLPLATVAVLFASCVYFLYLQWRAM